jgi:hypothetical protein
MYIVCYYMNFFNFQSSFTVRQDIQGIPGIYHVYTRQRSLASQRSFLSLIVSLRHGRLADLFSLGHREPAHARSGAAKVPQPGVDLIDMATPLRGGAPCEFRLITSFIWEFAPKRYP